MSGMVDQTMFTIMVATLPTSIPNEIEVDISALEVGESIKVEDVALPVGVRAISGAEEAVAIAVITRSTLALMRAAGELDGSAASD
jgi:large subunit ribosomal protein L25